MSKTEEAKERYAEAMSRLMLLHPFFASIFYSQNTKLAFIEEGGKTPSGRPVKTAATDGTTFYYNVKFFLKLTLDERVFLQAHEVSHNMFHHMGRAKLYFDLGIGPDMKPFNHAKWNRACDYIINWMLTADKVGKMPMGGLYDPNITADDLVDDIYCKLPDEDDDDEDNQQGFDDHIPADKPVDDADQANMKVAVQQAMQTAKAMGKLPGTLGKVIGNLMNPKVDWTTVVHREMMLAGTNAEPSWAKPNRRKLVMGNMIMPAKAGSTCGTIVCVMDTSCSITNQEAGIMLGGVKTICDDLHPERLFILWTDTRVAHVDEMEDMNDLDDIIHKYTVDNEKLPGGGGTDMPAAFKYMDEWGIDPTTCIVFTDGETGFGAAQSYPVVWAITQEGYVDKPTHGVSVHCDV